MDGIFPVMDRLAPSQFTDPITDIADDNLRNERTEIELPKEA
jgi:hypothetical protein